MLPHRKYESRMARRIRSSALGAPGCHSELRAKQKMRRDQHAAEGEEDGLPRRAGLVFGPPGTAPDMAATSLSVTGRRNARGKKSLQIVSRGLIRSDPGTGLRHQDLRSRDLYSLAQNPWRSLRVPVLLRMQRRKEQRLGCIVEALAARAVDGKRLGRCPYAYRAGHGSSPRTHPDSTAA